MKESILLIMKGVAMGAANIIPGVSGGTIALITGIFERLIHAFKSINFSALRLLLQGNFKLFALQTDLWFLVKVFSGVLIAILSLARLFEILFTLYPVYIWAYFFGLIVASVYFVGVTVQKWSLAAFISLVAGATLAIAITFMTPAAENRNFFYLMVCGVAAVCSMILPGISGSFVLILMGNYQLVAIEAINNLDFSILTPVLFGMIIGLILFSHFLSWLFKRYKDPTIALLTGFIFGSLGVIWPWKESVFVKDQFGEILIKNGESVVERYEMILPTQFGPTEIMAVLLMLLGILTIWLIEKSASKPTEKH